MSPGMYSIISFSLQVTSVLSILLGLDQQKVRHFAKCHFGPKTLYIFLSVILHTAFSVLFFLLKSLPFMLRLHLKKIELSASEIHSFHIYD